ncbi:MAG: hypothetical protein P4L72_00315 [Parvibaculum sp.]|uniref:hypothetical protein n=1 Tax=Parvibaculum sp. TaxID=2024848 RepID=UPI002842B25D|nr:hypothetical protein [Parvibaculum sp.]MDR3497649.1 hypothetical protein [Parvibaculum sp.]
MKRLARTALACLAIATGAATAASANAAMSREEYRASLAEIDKLQRETLAAADEIKAGVTTEAAGPQAAHFDERLTWLRTTITSATLSDGATLRHEGQRGDPQYARCLLWRAAEMEDHVQDVATDFAQLARGASATIPLDRADIASEGLRKGCPS